MSKITAHFAPVVPFHPTRRDPADAEIRTLRPKAECGGDWCLNGPPIEGASTYFLCGRCSRDSTDPVFLACILKSENKRRPALIPKPEAEAQANANAVSQRPQPHPSPIPGFDFDYMIAYCLEHYEEFANHPPNGVKMKFLNVADRWFRYRYCIMADIGYERSRVVANELRFADALLRKLIAGFACGSDVDFAAKLLHQLYANYGWALYKLRVPPLRQNFRSRWHDFGSEEFDKNTPYAFRMPLPGAITDDIV